MHSRLLAGVSVVALLTGTGAVHAAGFGGSTDWTTFFSGSVPVAGDNVSLIASGQTIVYDDGNAPKYGGLTVDGTLGGTTVLTLADPLTLNSSSTTIGGLGAGEFDQSGGTSNLGSLVLGSQQGSSGTVKLSGGVMNDDLIVGDAGSGTFINNATHTVSGNLILGNQATGSGTYIIQGDTAQTNVNFVSGGNGGNPNGALIVGNGGTGNFIQGTDKLTDPNNQVNVAGDLVLGQQTAAQGTYTLNSGTLTVGGQLAVGGQSTQSNVFTQNGGTLVLNNTAASNSDYVPVGPGFAPFGGALSIGGGVGTGDGSNAGGTGTYNLNNDGSISAQNVLVGATGTGTMNQAGGSITTTFMTTGFAGGSTGIYNMSGGTLNATSETVGFAGKGTFTQSDASAVNTTGTLFIGEHFSTNQLGSGTYNLSAGSLNVTSGNLTVGDGEDGKLLQTGGSSLTVGSIAGDPDMIVGAAVNSTGTYTLSGNSTATINGNLIVARDFAVNPGDVAATGTVTVGTDPTDTSTLSASNAIIGDGGIGTLVQNGGTVNFGSTLSLGSVGTVPNSDGHYLLNSGTVNAGDEQIGVFGRGTFNQADGINRATSLEIATGQNFADQANPFPRAGFYNMSGGALILSNSLTVGGTPSTDPGASGGAGTFNHTGGLVTVGQGFQGQVYPDGSTAPQGPNGPGSGTVGTLLIGAQSGANNTGPGGNNGEAAVGVYNLGLTGQSNTTAWGGYPSTTGTPPPAFDNAANAPYLQVYGNVILGRDGAGTDGLGNPFAAASGTFNLAGDGSHLQISHVVGDTANGSGGMVIGQSGIGAFNQSDNTSVNLDGGVVIGLNDGSQGSYTLNTGANGAGSLSVGADLDIGGSDQVGGPLAQTTTNGGTGLFTQNDGTVQVVGNLKLGTNTGANGTYDLNGGTLTVNNSGFFGNNGGTGTVNQTGGSATFGSDSNPGGLLLGTTPLAGPASTGSYNLSGNGATLTVNGNVDLGVAANTTGNFTVGTGSDTPTMLVNSTSASGGTDGILTVGDAGNGNLTVKSGTLTVQNVTNVGVNGVGTVIQSGGTFTTGGLNLSGAAGVGSSSYGMTGGTLHTTGDLNDGGSGSGGAVFNHNGGTVQVDGNLTVTDLVGGPAGQYTLTAGTLNVSGNSTIGFNTGAGTFTHTGGGNTITGGLTVGDQAKSNGLYQLSGAGTLSVGEDLVIGSAANSTGEFDLNTVNPGTDSGTITHLGGMLVVGDSGKGTFDQAAGVLDLSKSGGLDVGRSKGGSGTYIQTGGTLIDDAIIGDAGTGEYDNTGATHTVNGSLILGNQATGNGTYKLTAGGTTTVSSFATVGNAGTGTFNQSGNSSATFGTELDIGRNGGTGTYTIGDAKVPADASSLTVTTGPLVVGAFGPGGSGTLNQLSAGTVTVSSGDLIVGDIAGVTGAYNFSGTGSVTVSGTLFAGAAGNGTFTHSGPGTVTAGSITIGNDSGGIGEYDLTGAGTVSLSGGLFVGAAGGGTLKQSGVGSSITAGGLAIGNNQGGNGTYNLSAGSVTINGNTFLGDGVPASSQGTLTQTGGTAALNGDVNVGFAAGGTGHYTLGGTGTATIGGNLDIGAQATAIGTLDYNTAAGDNASLSFTTAGRTMTVGDAGSGTVNQGGGDLNLTGKGITLEIGAQKGGGGQYNLTGGMLEDDLIVGDAGTGGFSNTAGTHTVSGNLILGNQATGFGTYNLGGTGKLALATSGAQMILGNTAGAQGIFNFNTIGGDAGAITFDAGTGQQINVGSSGTGVFAQGGGDLDLNTNGVGLDLGVNPGSSGKYNLSGGSLETQALNIGDAGFGQFNQTGGTVTFNGTVNVGNQNGGDGQINQFDGAATVKGNLDIAAQTGSQGVVTITTSGGGNPSLTVTGDATVGDNGQGSYNQSGGTADIRGSMTVGANHSGGVEVSGGSLTVGDGGAGHQLLINSTSSMKIEDDNTAGGSVTVDGSMTNNGQVGLGLHDVTPSATLTVTQGLQNNGGFNFEANAILNANVTNGSGSNTAANFTAQNGVTTNVTLNGNMDNFANVNVSSLGGAASTMTQNGNFTNESTGTLTVIGSNLTINGSGTAFSNAGTANISEDVNGPSAPISVVGITGDVLNKSTGAITIQDSKVTVTGNADNAGTVTIQRDATNVNVGSTVTVTGSLTNESNASLTVANSSIKVSGSATNNGTVHLTNANATWGGTFTNNGAYHSDPSTSNFVDFTVGSGGYVTGLAGDTFSVSGNFVNHSTQNVLWSTNASTLSLTGNGPHELDLAGVDDGANSSGYSNNFAFGGLSITDGAVVNVGDGNTGNTSTAFYTGLFQLTGNDLNELLNISSPFNIYYDPTLSGNGYLLDKTYAFGSGGGSLIPIGGSRPPPVPEPASLSLLGTGLVGLGWLRRRFRRGGKPLH